MLADANNFPSAVAILNMVPSGLNSKRESSLRTLGVSYALKLLQYFQRCVAVEAVLTGGDTAWTQPFCEMTYATPKRSITG